MLTADARDAAVPGRVPALAAAVLAFAAGGLALRRAGAALPGRPVLALAGAAAAVLVAWSGANVLVGSLVLAGAVDPGGPVDELALRWHAFFWDPWFVVWGLALAWAARSRWRSRKGS